MKKEFKVSNEELVIYVKVVPELHDENRYLVIIHYFGYQEKDDEYRVVSSSNLMQFLDSYLR